MKRKDAGLNIRIERILKNEAEEVIRKLGLTPSEAITLFYIEVLNRGTLPFNFHRVGPKLKLATLRAILDIENEDNLIAAEDVGTHLDNLGKKMTEICCTATFKRDFKRIRRRGWNLSNLRIVAEILASHETLNEKYNDRLLEDVYPVTRNCQVGIDWELLYALVGDKLIFVRTGNHLDLFT